MLDCVWGRLSLIFRFICLYFPLTLNDNIYFSFMFCSHAESFFSFPSFFMFTLSSIRFVIFLLRTLNSLAFDVKWLNYRFACVFFFSPCIWFVCFFSFSLYEFILWFKRCTSNIMPWILKVYFFMHSRTHTHWIAWIAMSIVISANTIVSHLHLLLIELAPN